MTEIGLLILVIIVAWYVVSSTLYKRTDYYETTHKNWLQVRFNAGNYGEYLTYCALQKYEKDGAKFLYNCYLPKDNGETTEIDVLMIHTSGVYVFESKNYSGWIFGNEYQKTWTQTLPSGRKSHKEHFLNPIMQNKLHIKWLQNQIGNTATIHSIIVFSERCTLKQVDVSSSDIYVIKRNNVARTVRDIDARIGCELSAEAINDIYEKLYGFTQASDAVKEKHVADIKNHKEGMVVEEQWEVRAEDLCPRCGGKLVLRTTQRGPYAGSQFYGCSNYPRCKYIKNSR